MSETWADVLGPQALDLALLAAFVASALVSFFRKSVRLKYLTLAFGQPLTFFNELLSLTEEEIYRILCDGRR